MIKRPTNKHPRTLTRDLAAATGGLDGLDIDIWISFGVKKVGGPRDVSTRELAVTTGGISSIDFRQLDVVLADIHISQLKIESGTEML